MVVIPHLTERLSLLYQSNQKSFRAKDHAVGQTTCQHTKQEVVRKVILYTPSDLHCHHEDKKKIVGFLYNQGQSHRKLMDKDKIPK